MKRAAPSRLDCPSCGSRRIRIVHEARGVPVNSTLLLATREEAVGFPTGDILLGFCVDCGFIYNAAFDATLLEYSARYEETQGFSPTFRMWHEALARRLVERYQLRGKRIVEIGCGKGEFLTLLCELGGNWGLGFDPTYLPERNASPAEGRAEFIRDNYSEKYAGHRGDFVCCKMTLEHIADASAFVAMVRRSLGKARETIVFFQVPDVFRILNEMVFWDIYYEHCSYFSLGSLARLFRRCGFEVLNVVREYDDQYLMIEARPGNGTSGPCLSQEDDLEQLAGLVARFAAHLPARLASWHGRLCQYREQDRRVVVWGSGSKGVAFLTTLDGEGTVEYVVDINPNKHGHYMAKTGQRIVGPPFLRHYRPEIVLVMNPIYRSEIVSEIRRLDLDPEVVST